MAYTSDFRHGQVKALADWFEFHYTPNHGSWLNMAEWEISVLARQCLNRRIPDLDSLRAESGAWAERKNAAGAITRLN